MAARRLFRQRPRVSARDGEKPRARRAQAARTTQTIEHRRKNGQIRPNPAKSGQNRPHRTTRQTAQAAHKRPKPAMPKNHRNDTALILALAAGASIAQAAEAAGISERTACCRAADPAVRAEEATGH